MKVSPGLRGDLDHDAVREHLGAAGHGAPVAAGFADDGRRLTGDGRLVDRGDAFDDLAVAGDHLVRLDDDIGRRAAARCRAPTSSVPSARRRRAIVSVPGRTQRRRLRLPAALGHGLGEVGEHDGQPEPDRDEARRTGDGSRTKSSVVSTEPISTTNMTGLRHITRGSSLRNASGSERHMRCDVEHLGQSFHDRAQRERREVREGGDDDDHAGEQARRTAARSWGTCPSDSGTCFFRASEPATPSTSTIEANRPNSIANPIAVLKKVVFADSPPNALPLLLAPGRERVQDLGEAVRTRVEDRRDAPSPSTTASAGEHQDHRRHEQDVERDQLHLARFDLLARGTRASDPP